MRKTAQRENRALMEDRERGTERDRESGGSSGRSRPSRATCCSRRNDGIGLAREKDAESQCTVMVLEYRAKKKQREEFVKVKVWDGSGCMARSRGGRGRRVASGW